MVGLKKILSRLRPLKNVDVRELSLLGILTVSLLLNCGPSLAITPEDIRDEVFVTLQQASASLTGKALQQAALRQEADNQTLSSLLRKRQDLLEARDTAQFRLSDAVQRQGSRAEKEAANLHNVLADIQQGIDALDLEIEQAFPAFKELTNPRPMSREEVQQYLRPREALIVTFSTDYDVYVWAISKETASWHSAAIPTDEMQDIVTRLRRMLDVTNANRSAAGLDDAEYDISVSAHGFDRLLAFDLYKRLLAPIEHVFGNSDHIVAVTDGALTSLPLSVLVASPPQGDDDDPNALRETDWLVARHALSVLPNVSSLRALRRTEQKGSLKQIRVPFTGFGDPVFEYREASGAETGVETKPGENYISRGSFEKVQQIAGLAQLPNTAKELKHLARLTGVGTEELHLGTDATEHSVKTTDLSKVDILAFATHGLLTGEMAELTEPALVFTPPLVPDENDDALLTASEAASLKLSAQLIILSACNTAADDGTPGAEGLSGLARAFIYAGARSILVSHWPVDDYATSILTTGMVAAIQQGNPRAFALRQSILALMSEDHDPRFAHPRYWAPFILVGEGRTR